MLLKTARKLHQNASRVLCVNGAHTVVLRPELIQDKQGVVVTSIPTSDENGVIEQRIQSGSISDVTLMIKNNGRTLVTLEHITLLWSVRFFDYSDIATIDEYRAVIEPGMHLFTVVLNLRWGSLGSGRWGRERGLGLGPHLSTSLYPLPAHPLRAGRRLMTILSSRSHYAVSSGSRNVNIGIQSTCAKIACGRYNGNFPTMVTLGDEGDLKQSKTFQDIYCDLERFKATLKATIFTRTPSVAFWEFDDSENLKLVSWKLYDVGHSLRLPGNISRFRVGCKRRKEFGYSYVPVVFTFDKSGKEFHILRFLSLRIVSDIFDDLKAVAPYRGPRRPARVPDDVTTIPGGRLPE